MPQPQLITWSPCGRTIPYYIYPGIRHDYYFHNGSDHGYGGHDYGHWFGGHHYTGNIGNGVTRLKLSFHVVGLGSELLSLLESELLSVLAAT